MTISNEQIEAIRKRAESTSFVRAYIKGDQWKGYEVRNEDNGMTIAESSTKADAEFIVSARSDVPTLLTEVDRLLEVEYELSEKLYAEQMNFLETNMRKNLAINALREIDTHIRSTPDPIPYIIETLKKILPEYADGGGSE